MPESDCGALGKLKETGKKNNQINGREQDQKQQQRLAWRKKDCKGMKKVEEGRKNGAGREIEKKQRAKMARLQERRTARMDGWSIIQVGKDRGGKKNHEKEPKDGA